MALALVLDRLVVLDLLAALAVCTSLGDGLIDGLAICLSHMDSAAAIACRGHGILGGCGLLVDSGLGGVDDVLNLLIGGFSHIRQFSLFGSPG